MEAFLDFERGSQDLAIILLLGCGRGRRGGVSLRQLILIMWPQAVRQMCGVGRGSKRRGGGEG
jgi:hypothetical protein